MFRPGFSNRGIRLGNGTVRRLLHRGLPILVGRHGDIVVAFLPDQAARRLLRRLLPRTEDIVITRPVAFELRPVFPRDVARAFPLRLCAVLRDCLRAVTRRAPPELRADVEREVFFPRFVEVPRALTRLRDVVPRERDVVFPRRELPLLRVALREELREPVPRVLADFRAVARVPPEREVVERFDPRADVEPEDFPRAETDRDLFPPADLVLDELRFDVPLVEVPRAEDRLEVPLFDEPRFDEALRERELDELRVPLEARVRPR